MAAVSASGLPSAEFVFMGFPPFRLKDRNEWLLRVGQNTRLVVFFEAPHRVRQTLEALSDVTGPARLIAMCRELTKMHEELVVQPISAVIGRLSAPKGEFTILVSPATPAVKDTATLPEISALRTELGRIADNSGLGRREALKVLARRYGLGVNDLYMMLHEPD
jgi:16S rRNA (cytidine1402-2'-O)-methyltransferase